MPRAGGSPAQRRQQDRWRAAPLGRGAVALLVAAIVPTLFAGAAEGARGAVFSRVAATSPSLPRLGPRTTLLALDADAVRGFRDAGQGSLTLPVDGQSLDLRLTRFDVLTQDAVVTSTGDQGPSAIPVDITLFHGEVEGQPGSWVVLSLSPRGALGVIQSGGERYVLAPAERRRGTSAGLPLHAIARARDIPDGAGSFECGAELVNPIERGVVPEGLRKSQIRQSSTTRLTCEVAVDCDYEFWAFKQDSNIAQAADYALTLLGVVSDIYERDVNVALRVPFLNIWTTSSDPYSQTTTQAQLPEFQGYWNANRASVSRHIAHLLSGRSLGGGIAYLTVLCELDRAYGVSAIHGSYSYPSPSTTWDAFVVAHEIGHNFDSRHTQSCYWQEHGYAPPGALLDSCYTAEGPCYSGPVGILPGDRGTIMSYCHQLGPIDNTIRLDFHTACKSVMRLHAEQCLPEGAFEAEIQVSVNAVGSTVNLSWNASPVGGVIRYDVYRSPRMLDPAPSLVGSTASTSFADLGRIGTYFYRVRAVRESDQSAYSNEVIVDACLPSETLCFACGGSVLSPIAGDFDEDGITDLAVANGISNGTVTVLLGGGTGGVWDGDFAAPVTFAAGPSPSGMVAGDFNEDGITDFALSNSAVSGTFSILLGGGSGGVGDGTFPTRVAYSVGSRTSALVTGDFDEDGITDLAVANRDGNSVSIARGLGTVGVGNGTFAAPVNYGVQTRPLALATGDFNEDGISDLAVANNFGNSVSVLLGRGTGGRGDGTFAAAVSYPTGASFPYALSTGDFDEDGITDLAVVLNSASGALAILRGQGAGGVGNGTFAAPEPHATGASPVGVAIGDYNGDGIPDAAVPNGVSDGTVSLLLGQGTGGVGNAGFETPVALAASSLPFGVATGDFDEDGVADLVVSHTGSIKNACILLGGCTGTSSVALAVASPNGGENWTTISERTISWSKGDGITAVHVEVSRDDGATWERVASNVTGTSFTWSVPEPGSQLARVRVYDPNVPSHGDASNATFQITSSLLDAGSDRPVEFGLQGTFPNPAQARLSVSFSLPGNEPATLELFDVTGRRWLARSVGSMGAGRHVVDLETRILPSGLYVVRLAQGSRVVTAKAAVLR